MKHKNRNIALVTLITALTWTSASAVLIQADVDLSLSATNAGATDSVSLGDLTGKFRNEAHVTAIPFSRGQTRTTGTGFVPLTGTYGSTPFVDAFSTTFRSNALVGGYQLPGSVIVSGGFSVDYLLTFTIDTNSTFIFDQLSISAPEVNSAILQFGLQGGPPSIISQDISFGGITLTNFSGMLLPGTYELLIRAQEMPAGLQIQPRLDVDLGLTILDSATVSVPEPASLLLLTTGLLTVGVLRRRKTAQSSA